MDDRIKKLGKDQRIALARIVSDLIMSDKIIDDKEVETFANLFGESSNRELFLLAQRISFAQALKLLIQPYDETAKGTNNYNRSVRNYNANTAADKSRHEGTRESPLSVFSTGSGYSPFIAPYIVCGSSIE